MVAMPEIIIPLQEMSDRMSASAFPPDMAVEGHREHRTWSMDEMLAVLGLSPALYTLRLIPDRRGFLIVKREPSA